MRSSSPRPVAPVHRDHYVERHVRPDFRKVGAGLRSCQGHWETKVIGITTVALPPSGGANVALSTRSTRQLTTASERPPRAVAPAHITSPSRSTLAVILTAPFMFGSSVRPLL